MDISNLTLSVFLGLSLVLNVVTIYTSIKLGIKVRIKHPYLLAKKWAARAVKHAPPHVVNAQYRQEYKKDFNTDLKIKK